MSSVGIAFILSITARSWAGVAQRYSFLSAIALATADPTTRGPPVFPAQIDSPRIMSEMEKPARRHKAPRPASQSGVNRSA